MIPFAAAVISLALAGASPSAAPAIPDTPEGRQIRAFLGALERPDAAALREYVSSHYAPSALAQVGVDGRVERLQRMSSDLGALELQRVLAADGGRAEFVARASKNGDVLTVTLDLEPTGDRRIRGARIEADGPGDRGAPREASEPPKASDSEVAAAAGEWLGALAAKDEFSGAVLIARKGVPFFQRAYGMADRERGTANTVDTRFNVGSIGKAFTSAAVARLVRDGRLAYTDTIRKVLPDSRIPFADRITVRQLLDMTSGLGDVFGPEFAAAPHRLRELSDYLALFETKPLRFEPGAGREYSNAGYIVLGLMIEKLSGRKYRDVVRDWVLEPAGMAETAWFAIDEPAPRRAVGYTRRSEVRSHREASREPGGPGRSGSEAAAERRPSTAMSPGRGSSAGGGYSTVGDLLKFANAVGKGSVALARSDGPSGNLGIAGGAPGCNAVVEADPERGFTIVVLVNEDPPLAEKTAKRLRQWMAR